MQMKAQIPVTPFHTKVFPKKFKVVEISCFILRDQFRSHPIATYALTFFHYPILKYLSTTSKVHGL